MKKLFFLTVYLVYILCVELILIYIPFLLTWISSLFITNGFMDNIRGHFTVLFHFHMSWCILVKKLKILPLVVFYPIIVEMGCRLQSKAANASRNWMMRIRSCATAQALFSVTVIFVIFTNNPATKIVLKFVRK